MHNEEENKEEKWKPTVLVLGPGGLKGLLHLGALSYLEKVHLLRHVKVIAGCSVGAVIAMMLVAGYGVQEIIAESMKMSHLLQDLSSVDFRKSREHNGLLDQRIFRVKLEDAMKAKLGLVPTLKQLFLMTGLTLVTVALNIDRDEPTYFSHESDPDLSSVDAVLLSMNIPFLFYQLKYKGELYIDGAFASPYPVDRFDDGHTDILGIHITSHTKNLEQSLILYFYKIIVCAITQIKKRIEKQSSPRCKHIELFCPSSDFTGVTMSLREKSHLLLSGYDTAKRFYEKI